MGGDEVFCVTSNVLQWEKTARVDLQFPWKPEFNHVANNLWSLKGKASPSCLSTTWLLEPGIQIINPSSLSHSFHAVKLHALNLSKAEHSPLQTDPTPSSGLHKRVDDCGPPPPCVVWPHQRALGQLETTAGAPQRPEPGGQVGSLLVQLGCTRRPPPWASRRFPNAVEEPRQHAAASVFSTEHHRMHKFVLCPHQALPFPTAALSAWYSGPGESARQSRWWS